ncbi:hypothetical protein HY065_02390 [Candidatus Berkelbacteria bacterium]|nr:hypothetical protein [Candidatus Berkelbacteria bacterium]
MPPSFPMGHGFPKIQSLIFQYLPLATPWMYPLLFCGMIVEGDILLFVVGFLTSLGYFDLPLIAVTLWAGNVCGDALWYALGVHVARHHQHRRIVGWIHRIAEPFDHHLHDQW